MGRKRKASDISNGVPDKSPSAGDRPHTKKTVESKPSKAGKERRGAQLIFKPRSDWHAADLPVLQVSEPPHPLPDQTLKNVQEYAVSLLESENGVYNSSKKFTSSSHRFLGTIMTSGTWEDKVSALTLLVQESPLHNIKAFESLLGLARKKSRNQALQALQAIKDLLAEGVVLPTDRKLRPFARQPALLTAFQGKAAKWKEGDALPGNLEKVHLIYWAFEDWLKKTYFTLLTIIESWCNDQIEFSRKRALTFVFELLREKPEQEENLLRLLVNKLGDKEKRVASRASYLLLQLQNAHPAMKPVIVNAVESDLLFRPGQTLHAKYYAIITLNQTVLTAKEQEVANRLLAIYFNLFLILLKEPESDTKASDNKNGTPMQGGGGKPGKKARQKAKAKEASNTSEIELNDKVIAQVLAGVNRAYPFANTDDGDFEKHMDTMFRITHSSNFNTSIQALMLIQQISSIKHYSADRFYRTLYESLLDPRVLTSSKQIMYLNLLYKSLKSDVSIRRVKSFVKRLLQVITMHEPPFISGVLFLISELESIFPSIRGMLNQPEEDDNENGLPNGDATNSDQNTRLQNTGYDPRKRDPEYSNAQHTCLWELLPFLAHYHPSISLFGDNLLTAQKLPTKPDPTHYTLIHFLDRFAYRNAKTKVPAPKGVSIMQPLAGAGAADVLIGGRERARKHAAVNSEAFWMQKAEDVPADQVFFHKYFEQQGKRKEVAKRKKEKKGKKSDDDSAVDEEDEIWKALVRSRPDVEGEDEDDQFSEDGDGLNMEDMESDDEGGVVVDNELLEQDSDLDMDQGGEGGEDFEDDEELPDLEDDQEAFIGSDQDVPSDFEQFEDDEVQNEKLKTDLHEKNGSSKKRRKLKNLPTFASAEDYAKYLESEDEDD
ncbi:MAG: hypothetical protein M1822_008001 [Bathelium mastoideum]|nr:MAG: hypothetical protein M1822_008001 [Bathelium mastoideum]